MRFLCICHAITPGLAPILEHIASLSQHQLLIAQARQKKDIDIPNARHVKLKRPEIKKAPRNLADCWQIAAQIGKCALQSLEAIAQSGFAPDIVLVATLSGSSLCLKEIFPATFQVAYLENLETENEVVMRFRRQMRNILIMESELIYNLSMGHQEEAEVRTGPLCVTPSLFRPKEFSEIEKAGKFPEILFALSGLSRNDTNSWLRAIKNFSQSQGKAVHVLMPDVASLKEASGPNIPGLSFSCNLSNSQAAELFGNARLLVWPLGIITCELLQAMSCGVAIVAPQIAGLMAPGKNCIPLPKKNMPEKLREISGDYELLAQMGIAARKTILENFSQEKIIPAHISEIMSAMTMKKGK